MFAAKIAASQVCASIRTNGESMPFLETLKADVRKRSHHACCLCKSYGPVEIHHIIPEENGGSDTFDNAASLCPTCHEVYGMNPTKRKYIREARDTWFEICAARYAPDADRIDDLTRMMKGAVTLEQFDDFKSEILSILTSSGNFPRPKDEILAALDELWDKIWYNRHMNWKYRIERGLDTAEPNLWKIARRGARRIEAKYGLDALGPWTDFEWGMLSGKMSALRWVLGDEWDFLDT